mmetsp:Transcript_41145/g.102924  ORF Transcript_41145/g.102924 Transcript_41145/m.102924 type:complete len:179 (+) Transcript_41145:10-546(+)
MNFKNKTFYNDLNLQKNFLFYENLITVIVLKSFDRLNLLTFQMGPFKKGEKIKIKIWIAIILDDSNLCKLQNPSWLKTEWLEKKIFLEKKSPLLQNLPYFYRELGFLSFRRKKTRNFFFIKEISLIEEIFSIRSLKLWNGIQIIKNKINALKLDKIGATEFLNIKKTIQFFLYFLSFF